MAHIKDLRDRPAGYAGTKPYWARYRDPLGAEHGKTFRTLREARHWLAENEVAKGRGDWVDPLAGKITFETFAEQWRAVQVHRPSTAGQVESHFRTKVYPALGTRPLATIRPSHVQALVKALSIELAPSTVETIYRHVSAVFKAATRDRLIARTPCDGITLPKADRDHKVVPLELDQVVAVAELVPDRYRAAVLLAAGTGLRQGEVLGLTVDRVDFLRRQVKVDRQMVTPPGPGEPDFGPPKTKASYRTVPLPDATGLELARHLREFPPGEDGLIFTAPNGRPMRRQRMADAWRKAADGAGLPPKTGFHATRHFYASALIQFGESVKVVQSRLGHASAIETLDTYGHLWPDSEDRTRAAIDSLFGDSAGRSRDAVGE
jgi:integrase